MYAQQKRRPLQTENPAMSNADISRLLGEMWRNASPSEKQPHMEREEVERKLHKAKMEKWKNNQKLENAMKPSTPRSYRVTTPRAMVMMEGNGGDPRKLDRRQDVATFIREGAESHSRFGKSRIFGTSAYLLCIISAHLLPTSDAASVEDSGQSMLLSSTSHPTNASSAHWFHHETPENNPHYHHYHRRTDSSSSHEYRYDSSTWAAQPPTPLTVTTTVTARALYGLKTEEESSSARVVHYSYPRPPE